MDHRVHRRLPAPHPSSNRHDLTINIIRQYIIYLVTVMCHGVASRARVSC